MRRETRKPEEHARTLTWPEAVCALLISVGALLMLDQIFPFSSNVVGLCVQCAVDMALIWSVDCYRRARRIILLAGAAAVLLLLLILGWGGLWQYLGWWASSFPRDPQFSTSFYIFLTQTILRLITCLAVYLLVRCSHGAVLILISAGGLYLLLSLTGYNDNFAGVVVLLAGALALVARGSYWRYFTGKNTQGVFTPRQNTGRAALAVSSAAVLLACMLQPALLPEGDSSFWDRWNVSYEGGTKDTVFHSYNMASMGLQEKSYKLGGDISLSDTRPILSVSGDQLFSLRGKVYNVYNGHLWKNEDDSLWQFSNGLYGANQRNAFDILSYLPEENETLSLPAELEIHALSTGDCLFSNGAVQSIAFTDDELANVPVYYNERGELLSREVVWAPYTYREETEIFQRSGKDFDRELMELEQEIERDASYRDNRYNTLLQTNLQLPYDSLPAEITEITETLFQQEDSPYTKLLKLEEYFRSSGIYTYTLTPGEVPDGQDFVTYFLQTKRGYCVYFATAMAVLARAEGIPSRLVSGYCIRSEKIDEQGTALVSANDAHAWVECYLNGIGWVPFDPTPGTQSAAAPTEPQEGPEYQAPDRTSTAPASESSESRQTTTAVLSEPSSEDGSSQGNILPNIPVFVWILVPILLLITAFLLLQWYRCQTRYRLAFMQQRWKDPGVIADRYYRDMLHQLRLMKVVPRTGETLAQFVCRADEYLGQKGESSCNMKACGRILMNWRYGGRIPSEEELQLLEQEHEYLENYLKEKIGRLRYFVCRVIAFYG